MWMCQDSSQDSLLQMNWGLNPLFDTFDCQVHFFEGPGLAQQLRMRGHSVAIL